MDNLNDDGKTANFDFAKKYFLFILDDDDRHLIFDNKFIFPLPNIENFSFVKFLSAFVKHK